MLLYDYGLTALNTLHITDRDLDAYKLYDDPLDLSVDITTIHDEGLFEDEDWMDEYESWIEMQEDHLQRRFRRLTYYHHISAFFLDPGRQKPGGWDAKYPPPKPAVSVAPLQKSA